MSYMGAAANVVGGEMEGWAAVLEKRAMAEEFQKELARQQGYRQQGLQTFGQALDYASPETTQKQLAEGREGRVQRYNEMGAVPFSVDLPNRGGTNDRRDVLANRMRGGSQAALGSYSDWGTKQAIGSEGYQQKLNKITNFAGGTASVFPYRMYQAQHSMDDLAMIGAAIASIGGGAANYSQFAQAPQGGQGVNYPQGFTGPMNFGNQQVASPLVDAGQGYGSQYIGIG